MEAVGFAAGTASGRVQDADAYDLHRVGVRGMLKIGVSYLVLFVKQYFHTPQSHDARA